MLIDMSESNHLRGRSIRFDENSSSETLSLPKFILYAHLISYLIDMNKYKSMLLATNAHK